MTLREAESNLREMVKRKEYNHFEKLLRAIEEMDLEELDRLTDE